MTIAIELCSDVGRLRELAPEWDALLCRSASNEPVLTPLWQLAWWQVFGALDGRRLQALVLRRERRLIGLLLLVSRRVWHRSVLPLRRLELSGSGEDESDEICSDYLGPIVEIGEELAVAQAIAIWLMQQRDIDELLLPRMDGANRANQELVHALRCSGFGGDMVEGAPAPYIPLASSFEGYLAELSPSRRAHLQRARKDFSKWAGDSVHFRHATDRGSLAEGKQVLAALHGERWRSAGKSGVFASTHFAAFHDLVLPALLEKSALDLHWLEAHGRPVASAYNIHWNRKVYHYQSGRSLDLPKSLSPGVVLLAHCIEAAAARGDREFDFLPGRQPYKLRLALKTRPLIFVRAARPTFRQSLRW